MDTKDKFASFGLSMSAMLFALFYKLYKSNNSSADQIKSSKVLHVGDDLAELLREVEGNTIAYATVEGIVSPVHQTINSRHSSHEGVIHNWELTEHKSRRVQGYWSDVKRVIRNTIDLVPFTLMNPDEPGHQIHITEANTAEFIMDDLTVTFDQFNPEKPNLLQAGIDRVFGEVTKGFQETEKMLLVGTSLVGIGEICLQNNQIKLAPPTKGSYILSKLSRNAIIRKYESQSFVYKVMAIILGSISAGLTIYIVWKFTKRFLEQKRSRRIFEAIRAANRNSTGAGDVEEDSLNCIICLSNVRDVVILNCGHVCVCSHCAEILPEPRSCPMCRAAIERFVALYRC